MREKSVYETMSIYGRDQSAGEESEAKFQTALELDCNLCFIQWILHAAICCIVISIILGLSDPTLYDYLCVCFPIILITSTLIIPSTVLVYCIMFIVIYKGEHWIISICLHISLV